MPEQPTDEFDEVEPEEVEAAEAVETAVRHPHHDDTTEREAVEQALEEQDLSGAGAHLGDEMD